MDARHYDLIVIGGGASGMMAAGVAAARGKFVAIIEKNKHLGKKLAITGGGRCNITNAESDIHALLANYGDAQDYLYSAFARFGVADTMLFFERLGITIRVEDRKRAFPMSERAADVVSALLRYCIDNGVQIHTDTRVHEITTDNTRITSIITNNGEFTANSFVLATGGMSHPETGSTGDGFSFLSELGHTVQRPTPTIVPLATREKWVSAMAGQRIADAKITYYCDGKKRITKRGPLLFTHFGISGPVVLNTAGAVADLLYEGVVTAVIDLHPAYNAGEFEQRVLSILDMHKNKTLKTILRGIMGIGAAASWAPVFASLDIDPDVLETKVHSLGREDRKTLLRVAKALPVTITRLMDFDRAVVADGGVLISEIDMKTMRSTLYPNLYVTGDLLHITRPSGGYSLQLCWTTGYIAGSHA